MSLTQQDVIDILKQGTYPYQLHFFKQDQKFPIYPSVEVRRVSTPSNTTDVQKLQIDTTFEVKLLIKYNRDPDFEEADRLVTEQEIIDLLEDADLPTVGKIFFEQKNWNTQTIDTAIFGSHSTLRFTYREIESTTGEGIIEAFSSIELDVIPDFLSNSITIQVLDFSDTSGSTVHSHYQDSGETQYDPLQLVEGEFSITYEETTDTFNAIDTLTKNREEVKSILNRGGVSENVLLALGTTTRKGSYGEVSRATTQFFIVGTF